MSHEPTGSPQSPAPSRPRGLPWKKLLLLIVVAGVVVASVAIGLLRTTPAHYRQHRVFLQQPPEVIRDMAVQVEQRVTQTLLDRLQVVEQQWLAGELEPQPQGAPMPIGRMQEQTRQSQLAGTGSVRQNKLVTPPTVISLSVEEINAWIAENLADWMAYKGYDMPREVRDPMFALEDGGMTLAFQYDSPEYSQVFSAHFAVTIDYEGRAHLNLLSAQAGNLPIPTHAIGTTVANGAPGSEIAQKVGHWLDKLHNYEFSPVIKLDQGRKLRVLDYQVGAEGVDLTVELESPIRSSVPDRVANVPVPNS